MTLAFLCIVPVLIMCFVGRGLPERPPAAPVVSPEFARYLERVDYVAGLHGRPAPHIEAVRLAFSAGASPVQAFLSEVRT